MPSKIKKLFISYRSSDAVQVDKIARDLELLKYDNGAKRFTTWQDKHNLPPASPNWWDAIVDAIIDSDVFVFNLSKASLQSEVCRAELDYAHKRNRPIIPVVLHGEFYLDPQSGKYNINYWDLVPDWLRDVQFLFYLGADFYSSFQSAIEDVEKRSYRDIDVKRPINPDSKSVHGSNHAVYDTACDYAERLAFTDAEKHFSTLLRRNDSDYADVAAEWLELLNLYAELIEISERRSARFIFKSRWASYQALFPKFFLENIFDPKGFSKVKVKPNSPPVKPKPVSPPEDNSFSSSEPTSKSLMPKPFDWVTIPAGKVTLVENHFDNSYLKKDTPTTFDVAEFQIAKYPITNAQFRVFVDEAKGYDNDKWWTETGWQVKQKHNWIEPRYWQDSEWNNNNQPVVGVSWYEAIAFCLWLSDTTGEKIMLPTEQQWQRAAQGNDGRTYPWGNDWDCERCNNSVKPCNSNVTTIVTQYEGKAKGDSPFGVVDMVGNGWEWCLTDYKEKTNDINSPANRRVLLGGSWDDDSTDYFRCVDRSVTYPHSWNDGIGFRLSRS